MSCHRWGQVVRVCPGVWEMPQVRGFLAAGGLFAVAAPIIFHPCFPPSPPPLNPPPTTPDGGGSGQTQHKAVRGHWIKSSKDSSVCTKNDDNMSAW